MLGEHARTIAFPKASILQRQKGRDMAATPPAILAVGAIMVDLVCHMPRLPQSGEGAVAESVRARVGGCAFNSANVIRQLGAPHTLFAPVGEGIFAGFVERELRARGLDAFRAPARSDGAVFDSGGCVCLVEPDGERTMLTLPGIDRQFERSWFDALDPSRFGYGLASGYEIEGAGGDAIISFFEDHAGIQLYYAPGPRILGVGPEKTSRINALNPVWHLNDQEALAYTGCSSLEEAGFAIAHECGNAAVITAGAAGASVFADGVCATVPTEQVDVVDSIGAGDAHLGALIAARAAGRPWEDALAVANRVAAAVCQVEGGVLDDGAFAKLGVRV